MSAGSTQVITMINVVRRNEKRQAGAVRYSVGRKSSGVGTKCLPLNALANPYKLAPYGPYRTDESLERYKIWLEKKIVAKDGAVCKALNKL